MDLDRSVDAEKLAQLFHETYERLAPEHSYEMRKESAKPWSEVPEQNRKLMVATCSDILHKLAGYPIPKMDPAIESWPEMLKAHHIDETVKLHARLAEAKRMEEAAWDDWDRKREAFQGLESENKSLNEHNDKLVAELTAYREACAADETAMIAKKNAVYRERDACVAAMAKMALKLGYACGLGKHEESDETWDRDWMNIVYIEVPHPSGRPAQLSWHIHDDELPMFSFLPPYDEKWDGHTTEEKYQHMAEFCGGNA